jgi:hypothetical protein
MFGSIFDSMFGSMQSSHSKNQILQLYELQACSNAALIHILIEEGILTEEQSKKVHLKMIEFLNATKKTHLQDEWEDYGLSGSFEQPYNKVVDEATGITWDAIFALINHKWDDFKKLALAGPSEDAVEKHTQSKEKALKARKEFLAKEAAKKAKQASCEHSFGFINRCSKCGAKKHYEK